MRIFGTKKQSSSDDRLVPTFTLSLSFTSADVFII